MDLGVPNSESDFLWSWGTAVRIPMGGRAAGGARNQSPQECWAAKLRSESIS
jgi:hypothetical protein